MTTSKNEFLFKEFDTIDSTNDELRRLWAKEGVGNYAVLSNLQTKGRGRNSRQWLSIEGNLHFSFCTPIQNNKNPLSELSFVAAIAAIKSLPTGNFLLKWPNDILLNDKKCGGFLLESLDLGKKNQGIVVGLGLNLKYSPKNNMLYPVTNLAENGIEIDKDIFVHDLLENWKKYYLLWLNKGMDNIRNIWLNSAAGINKEINIKSGDMDFSGIFRDITNKGELVIETQAGLKYLQTGDVWID